MTHFCVSLYGHCGWQEERLIYWTHINVRWKNNVKTEKRLIYTTVNGCKWLNSSWSEVSPPQLSWWPYFGGCGHQQQYSRITDVFQLFHTIPFLVSIFTHDMYKSAFLCIHITFGTKFLNCQWDKIYYLITVPCVRLLGSDLCQCIQIYIPDPVYPCCMSTVIFFCWNHNSNACM